MTKFHEEVAVEVKLGEVKSAGHVNRELRRLGFALDYDVYSMARTDGDFPLWQSECLVEVELLKSGKVVDAQDGCDSIRLIYPLATLDSSMIVRFADVVDAVSTALGGRIVLNGVLASTSEVVDFLTACATEVMKEWGEEPGSENLVLMIEANYGR